MDVNTLENLKLKGYTYRASIDSFNNAVQAAIAQKKLQQRQEPITQYEPQRDEIQQQQPIIAQTTQTTTQTTQTIEGDSQAVSDLQEASIEETEELERPSQLEENAGDIAE